MTGTGGNVRYNIYQDAARTIRWGSRYNTALGGVPNITIPGASTITYTTTIYGRIISGQSNVTPGNYSSLFSGTQVEFSRLDKNESDCITSPIDPKTPTASPSFTVSVAPIADCTISVGALSFGTQGVLAQNVDASSTLAVTCTNNTPFTVGMGNGLTGTSPTARKMTLGANSVIYAVYQNSSRTTIWSNASTVGGTGNGSAVTLNVYGRVPSQTTPVAGNYSDSVVVTVTF